MRLPLSMYVVETKDNNSNPILFNTVTRQHLPINATNEELVKSHFTQGSEKDAIWSYLLRREQKTGFTIITTWECNLRCTHCSVSHKLMKDDTTIIDVDAIVDFLNRFQQFYQIPRMMLTFLGGEPLLRPQSIIDCINKTAHLNPFYGITTNLTVPIDDKILEIMHSLHSIGVSVDGTHITHNEQRKSICLISDPFLATINNLKILIKAGFKHKIIVQGAIPDKYLNIEHRKEFYRFLLKLGIPYKNITYACQHPTVKHPEPNQAFYSMLKSDDLRGQVCCKYRYHNFILDRDGTIFTDYYTWDKTGHITDSIETIDQNIRATMAAMPALNDPTCRSCPAIGYCWGGCTNGQIIVGDSPSKYCDKDGLIRSIKHNAEIGSLVGGTLNDHHG